MIKLDKKNYFKLKVSSKQNKIKNRNLVVSCEAAINRITKIM